MALKTSAQLSHFEFSTSTKCLIPKNPTVHRRHLVPSTNLIRQLQHVAFVSGARSSP